MYVDFIYIYIYIWLCYNDPIYVKYAPFCWLLVDILNVFSYVSNGSLIEKNGKKLDSLYWYPSLTRAQGTLSQAMQKLFGKFFSYEILSFFIA